MCVGDENMMMDQSVERAERRGRGEMFQCFFLYTHEKLQKLAGEVVGKSSKIECVRNVVSIK